MKRMYFLSCAHSDLCSLPVCEAFQSAYEKLEFSTTPFAHGPEVLAALAEPDAPHSRKAAAAAERHDVTLMQPPPPEPAFDEYSVTLAVLDLHCETNVWGSQLDFCSLPVCAAFRSAYGKLEFCTTPFAHGPEVLAALAERDDITLMQPLLPEPAFLMSTP